MRWAVFIKMLLRTSVNAAQQRGFMLSDVNVWGEGADFLVFCRLISAITRLMSPQPCCVSQCRCRWFAAVHVITDAQTQHDSQSQRCSRLCCKVIWIIYYSRRVDAQGGCGVTEDSHWTAFRVVEEITGERGAHTGTAYCATTAMNKATTWC